MIRTFVWCGLAVIVILGGCSDNTSDASAGGAAKKAVAAVGEDTYNKFCFSCHAAGIAGAPALGDTEAWAPRIAKGDAIMLRSVIEGMSPGMPPRGLCASCSDQELADAVDYIVAQSK